MHAPAGPKDVAIREDDFEADDVMAGNAIFEAAWPTSIRRHISANAAIVQTRRIGRIKKPLRPHRGLQLAGDNTRLHNGDGVFKTDLLDPIHAGERKRDASAGRHATTDVTKTCAARCYRNPI